MFLHLSFPIQISMIVHLVLTPALTTVLVTTQWVHSFVPVKSSLLVLVVKLKLTRVKVRHAITTVHALAISVHTHATV